MPESGERQMAQVARKKLFDPACHELAEYFLREDDQRKSLRADEVGSLAVDIQTAVEEWFFIRDALPGRAAISEALK